MTGKQGSICLALIFTGTVSDILQRDRQREFPTKGMPAMAFETMLGESFSAFAYTLFQYEPNYAELRSWNLATYARRMVRAASAAWEGNFPFQELYWPHRWVSRLPSFYFISDGFKLSGPRQSEKYWYKRSELVGWQPFDLGVTACIMEEIKGISEINGGKHRTEIIPVIWPTAKEWYCEQGFQSHLWKP